MLQRILAISTLALAAFAAAGPAHGDGLVAATAPPPVRMQYGSVAIEASIGVMQGEANEYVYRPDHTTVSQLVWAFDNDVVFNGGIAVMPLDWLALGIRARTNISDPSTMDDYDWFRPPENDLGCPNDYCHSHHDNTSLTSYLSVDAYLAATFYENSWIAFKALAGYKRDSQSWRAIGGYANYTTYAPGQLVISYDQVWRAPYLGLQFNGEWDRWTLQGRVIGSWWVDGQDQDNHHIRTLLFTDNFGASNMVGANAHIGYRLTQNLMLKGEYDLQQWDLAKGPSTNFDYTTGVTVFNGGNAAGGQSISQTFSLGAELDY